MSEQSFREAVLSEIARLRCEMQAEGASEALGKIEQFILDGDTGRCVGNEPGGDHEIVFEPAARALSAWLGYSWAGLDRGRIGDRGEFKPWVYSQFGGLKFQGKQGDLIDIVAALVKALPSARDGRITILAEIQRLRPHYRASTGTDQARRQLLDHLEKVFRERSSHEIADGLLPVFAEGWIGSKLLDEANTYLKDYVYSPDEGSDHAPTAFEGTLIEDFFNGLFSDPRVTSILQEAGRNAVVVKGWPAAGAQP